MNHCGTSSGTIHCESDSSAVDCRYLGKDIFNFLVCNLCGRSSFFLIYLGANERAVKYRYTKKVQLYCPSCIPDPDHYRQMFPGENVYQAGSILNDRNLLSLLEGYHYCNPYYTKYSDNERIIITENTKLRSSYKPLMKRPIPKHRKMKLLMGLFIDAHRMPFQKFTNVGEHCKALQQKYNEICNSYMNLSDTEAIQMHDMFDTLIERTPRHLQQPSQSQVKRMAFPSPILENPAEASDVSSDECVEAVCHLGPQIDVLRSLESSTSGSDQASIASDINLSSQDVSIREQPTSSQSALQISSQSVFHKSVVPSSQSFSGTSSQNPLQISSQSISDQGLAPSSQSQPNISSQNVASQEVAVPPAPPLDSLSYEVNISSQEMHISSQGMHISSQEMPIVPDTDTSSDSNRTTRRRRSASPVSTNSSIQLDDPQPGPSGLNQPRTKRPRQELPTNPTPDEMVRRPSGNRMPRLGGG